MRWLPFGVLAALLLSGCAGDGDNARPAEATPGTGSDPLAVAAPAAWKPSEWWEYEARLEGEDAPSRFLLIVTENGTQSYQLESTNRTVALYDAKYDISYVGPIRKPDLSGLQGAQPVEFFRWPLEAGTNWTTTWDGVLQDLRVVRLTAQGVEIEARTAERTTATYSYDPAAGFFGHIEFYGPSGTVQYALRLLRHGAGTTQTAVRASVALLYNLTDTAGVGPRAQSIDFSVGPEASEVAYVYEWDCSTTGSTWSFAAGPVSQNLIPGGSGASSACTGPDRDEQVLPAEAGPWSGAYARTFIAAGERFQLLVESRTYTVVDPAK